MSAAAKRRHRLQRWCIAGGIFVLAVVLIFSITGLRRHAADARQAQLLVSELDSASQRISRIEWQAAAEEDVPRELDEELHQVHEHIDGLLHGYTSGDPSDERQLDAEVHVYLAAVTKQLALVEAGRLAESEAVDEREVDPSFEALQERLELIDADESETAQNASDWADRGIAASLMLAALILVALLWRLDTVRAAATRQRQQDLETQALHDALTGLPNRRKLQVDLERELLRAKAGENWVLLLCDLDGFKAYNDSFGHPEGDLLLGRLSQRLALTVAPYGSAYRLGGDEFCALVRVDQGRLEPVLAACHAALREAGSGFDIQASIGFVALSEEGLDTSTALRLADQRMYAQKGERGAPAREQLRDLVMRLLAERDPALYEHVHHVALLAAGVGRRLGLNDAQVVDLVQAAELHDIGKVAIPDSILGKPGPLDVDEMEFMRRHTLIGERILTAAPALERVGRLVRSSHERYDGAGYPDGLREEEIPLSSRIIFACDSFNAMTTDRPYRRAMNVQDALPELRRCSNTQFDPDVVDALVLELAAMHDRLRPIQESVDSAIVRPVA